MTYDEIMKHAKSANAFAAVPGARWEKLPPAPPSVPAEISVEEIKKLRGENHE